MFFKAIRNLYIQIQGGISQRYQVQKLKKIIATNFTNYLTSDNLINHKFYPKESLLCLDDVDSLNILVMQTIKHYLYQFKGMISLQTLKDIWLACCSIFSFIFLIESQQIHIFEYLQQILGILVVENTDLILNLAFQSKSQLNLERLMGILLFQQQKQPSQLSQDYHFTIKQYEILCKIKICCLCEVLMSKYLRQNKWFCDQYLNEIIQTLSCFYEQLRFAKEQQLQFDLYQQIKCKNALNFQRQNLSQYPYTIDSLPIKQIIKQSIQKLVDSVLQLSCQTLKIIDELVKYLENPEEYSEEFYQLKI